MQLLVSVLTLAICCLYASGFQTINHILPIVLGKINKDGTLPRNDENGRGKRLVENLNDVSEVIDRTVDMSGMLDKTLEALDRGLNYMWKHHAEINLDGVIGTRVVEGQAAVLLQTIETKFYTVPSDVTARIHDILDKATQISDASMILVQSDQPEYYERIGGILKKDFWALDYTYRNTDPSLVTLPVYKGEVMTERDSDDCLTELLGTSKARKRCDISRHCWNLMTSSGYQGYSLSHEVFYILIGESAGCFHGDVLYTTDLLLQEFCANMLDESVRIATSGYPEWRKDLFMEQQALCAMSGFEDFLREEWLQTILTWQMAEGCWGEHIHNNISAVSDDSRPKNQRFKREERILGNGCGSHRTAVAISALIQYLKHMTLYLYQTPT